MSVQCITCTYCVMDESARGKGLCWKDAQGMRKRRDVLEKRECRLWKLGPMHSVKSRSQRRMVFNESGIVKLQ